MLKKSILSSHGIFFTSRIFNDFGSKFEVIDATGEEPLTGMVAAITNVSHAQ